MIISPAALDERRQLAGPNGPLAGLYDSLASDLEPWLGQPLYLPERKALLSRAGGRCDIDGALLEFDPSSPHEHRCPQCHRVHAGDAHHRAWIMPYQLWLAERGLQAALFFLLRGDLRHARFARDVLSAYAERYVQYPNVDNVLGPSRLFFSTYLESVWLLQICLTAHFLGLAGDDASRQLARASIVEPAREMIAEFNEGMSNRQVWNNAALIAAALLCDDDSTVTDRVSGASGVETHLKEGLFADASWYEGENYHQFALRGLWYSVTLLDTAGVALASDLVKRFDRAFAVPVLTALPDFTMPSRKDSQYATSLRQWRLAELLELGMARRRDPLIAGALARCYESRHERRDTGRARSTADIERNSAGGALSRTDLGWRALLHALPGLPAVSPREPRSAILHEQGYAVFRREKRVYAGFEFGQSGGGHGHPDRLSITLYSDSSRWLDDMGTGSYVDPSLHWFRSTLAHNAPLVDGQSQPIRDATLLAYDEREGLGWIVAELRWPDNDIRVERALVVTPDYLIDDIQWVADRPARIDLPWHCDPVVPPHAVSASIDGGPNITDGFAFLEDASQVPASAIQVVTSATTPLVLTMNAKHPVDLFFASAPGQPSSTRRRLALVRSAAVAAGRIRTVVTWTQATVRLEDDATVVCVGDECHRHRRDEKGWHVELTAAGARSSIDLAGHVPRREAAASALRPRAMPQPMRIHRSAGTFEWLSEQVGARDPNVLRYDLGEGHYRRSELTWQSAGAPSAQIAISAAGSALVLHGVVQAGDAVFATADARNDYDNEHPDTMRAGVQFYLQCGEASSGWMCVPEEGSGRVRVRRIRGSFVGDPVAHWRVLSNGWEFRIELNLHDRADAPLALDMLINETTTGRERRRGQLVLSGARGEFVYLRGDRHDDGRLIPMVIVP
ncbi:MAG TPA: heparinase II/III family protein [Gemmatimonadaceae bacterium]|nr:heparinase II/III family protein [Gemmatimonadaceae bacterium]